MSPRIVLFGAFDRHNLGDLLLAHLVADLLVARGIVSRPDDLVLAGLAARDLRAFGGHRVQPIAEVLAAPAEKATTVIHVGGEVLTCSAWQAAVMLLDAADVQPTLTWFDSRPRERRAWARRQLGLAAAAPYVLRASRWPAVQRVIFNAVGGVALHACAAPLRAEVRAALREAAAVGVRDAATQAQLAAAGLHASLLPDPAVLVAELRGGSIRRRAMQGEVARLREAFPQGYLALQFSAAFGDDRTLDVLAAQCARIAAATGLGLALFRAGAAPWHDDAAVYERFTGRLPPARTRVLTSLHIDDLCALIAHSRGYCGSSLHGRIVALAFGLPRVNLWPPACADDEGKQAAFASAWDDAPMPGTVAVDGVAAALERALDVAPALLAQRAAQLAARFRQGFDALCAALA